MRILLIFFLNVIQNIIGLTFGALFPRKKYRNSYRTLSNMDKVKYLEKRRQLKGYRKKWLYHRCKEEGLLKEYNKLYNHNIESQKIESKTSDNIIRFTFGKYKGRPVEEILKLDKGYIDWVRENVDLSEYPDEEFAFEVIFNEGLL